MPKKNAARRVGGLEIRVVRDEKTNNLLINHNYVIGHVGQFAMELFRAEMSALEPLVDCSAYMVGGNPANFQSLQRTAIEHCVKRSCDGAEKLFAEMTKRGWLFEAPGLDEIIEPPVGAFGIHPHG
jgi:hypothetical protein